MFFGNFDTLESLLVAAAGPGFGIELRMSEELADASSFDRTETCFVASPMNQWFIGAHTDWLKGPQTVKNNKK